MRRKSLHVALIIVCLIATVAVAAQTASASDSSSKVVFRCTAVGNGIILWGGVPDEIEPIYTETLTGSMTCGGSAMVGEAFDGWYAAEPGQVRCRGTAVVRWTHNNERYKLVLHSRSTDQTNGLFIPEGDYFTVPIPEHPESRWQSYKGLLFKNRESQRISGFAGAGASYDPSEDKNFILFVFTLDLDDGTPGYVTLAWLEDQARVFQHRVEILKP